MNFLIKSFNFTLILVLVGTVSIACKEQSTFTGGTGGAIDPAESSSGSTATGGDDSLQGEGPASVGIGGIAGVDGADGPDVVDIGGIGNPDANPDFPSGGPNNSTSTIVSINGTSSTPLDKPVDGNDLVQGISFDPGKGKTSGGFTIDNTQSVVFALDVTGSMDPNINGLKAGVVRFAQKLFQNGFKVKVGLVTFADIIKTKFNLTNDLALFKSTVNRIVADGGNGANEASLTAISVALDMLKQQASPTDVKSVVVITDNPGHNTIDAFPVCHVAPIVSKLNALDPEQQKLTKLFYSVSNRLYDPNPRVVAVQKCSGYLSAFFQMNDLLKKSLTVEPNPLKRGGPLSYPFNGDVVIDDFVNKLKTVTPTAEEICIAQKADLFLGGKLVSSWRPDSYDKVYQLYQNATQVRWLNPVTGAQITPGPNAQVKVFRCCYTKADADKGLFNKTCPRGGDPQEVGFTVN